MEETTWVRSAYVYVVCGIALVLLVSGAVTGMLAISNAISPDLGHRDTLDRVGIGVSNIASDILERLEESAALENEDYCATFTDGDDEFEACLADLEAGEGPIEAIAGGIGDVRSELESQIRSSAISQLIRGALLAVAGVILFATHAHHTILYGAIRRPKAPADVADSTDAGERPPEP